MFCYFVQKSHSRCDKEAPAGGRTLVCSGWTQRQNAAARSAAGAATGRPRLAQVQRATAVHARRRLPWGVLTCAWWLWWLPTPVQEHCSHPSSPDCSLGWQIRRLNVSVALSSLFGDLNFISQFQASHLH